jgi:hypothetical protein
MGVSKMADHKIDGNNGAGNVQASWQMVGGCRTMNGLQSVHATRKNNAIQQADTGMTVGLFLDESQLAAMLDASVSSCRGATRPAETFRLD